jgi:hypothetical protein
VPDNEPGPRDEVGAMVSVCRVSGCPHPPAPGSDLCFEHGVRYVEWRTWRDQLDREDVRHAGPEAESDPAVVRALEALAQHLTSGPF